MLACLLLAGQAFTAYMVFNQRGQIHDMEKTNDNMRKQLRNRPPGKGGRGEGKGREEMEEQGGKEWC